jgi:uncharacterized protein YecT (DUF1311 family)
MAGTINPGDLDKFKRILPKGWSGGKAGPTMCLNSPGGDFLEGLKIAQFVSGGITTSIEAGATCASACGWIFLAGTHFDTGGSEWSRLMDARSTLWFHAPAVDITGVPNAASEKVGFFEKIQAYNQAVAEIGRGLLSLGQKYASKNPSQPLIPPTLLAEALVMVGNDKLFVDTTGAAIKWSIGVTGYSGMVPRSRADIVRACVLGSALANQFWTDEYLARNEIEEYVAFYDAKSRTLVAEVVVSGLAHIACEIEFVFDESFKQLQDGVFTVTANMASTDSVTRSWIRDRYDERTTVLPDFAVLSYKTALKNLPMSAGAPVDPLKLATVHAPGWCTTQPTKAADETAVCENSKLSVYDVLLGQYYNEALGKSDTAAKEQLRNQQKNWLVRRRLCADDVKCLDQAYHSRIAQVKEMLQ